MKYISNFNATINLKVTQFFAQQINILSKEIIKLHIHFLVKIKETDIVCKRVRYMKNFFFSLENCITYVYSEVRSI